MSGEQAGDTPTGGVRAWMVAAGLGLAVVLAVAIFAVVNRDPGGPAKRTAARGTSATTTTTAAPTTTAVPAPTTWPLTGLPLPAGVNPEASRAVVVKFDAHPDVRTYEGVEQADVVYEELVEGGLTRFAGVFHSSVPASAGPVRSVRSTDFSLLADLNHPVLVFSGGNKGTVGALGNTSLQAADPDHWASPFFARHRGLPAPHNLYVRLADLLAAAPGGGSGPGAVLPHRASPVPGIPRPVVDVPFSRETVTTLSWDAVRGEWIRTDNRGPRTDAAGRPLGFTNALILTMGYGSSPYDGQSPEAQPVGSGVGLALHDGQAFPVLWSRPTPEGPIELTTPDGAPTGLNPGRTLVELQPSHPG